MIHSGAGSFCSDHKRRRREVNQDRRQVVRMSLWAWLGEGRRHRHRDKMDTLNKVY
jgi:hypothetical protein